MKLIITFCEGQHDAAFIYRILKSASYRNFTDKIQGLPDILKNYFKSLFNNFEYLNVGALRQSPSYPAYLLKKGDLFVLLYPVGGVTKLSNAIPLIKNFKTLAEGTLDTEAIPIAFHFVLDAEELQVERRVGKIIGSLSEIIDLTGLEHKKILISENLAVNAASAYIFSGEDGKGKLEDILIPLMKKENDKVLENSEKFIDDNFNETRVSRNNFHKDKSIINIVGQLQRSGSANTVIITQTDYLTDRKIKKNTTCKEIIETFKELENNL